MTSESTTTTPTIGVPTTAAEPAGGGASSTAAAAAVSNAKQDDRICVVCYDDCTCIDKKPSSTISTSVTAASTSNLVETLSSVTPTTSAAAKQTTAPASGTPAATSSSTTTSSKFSGGTPSSSTFRIEPVSAAATTNAVLARRLCRPRLARPPVFSRLGTAAGFVPTLTTMGRVPSSITAPAATTTTVAVSAGLISTPAAANPVFSGSGGANGFTSTVTTTTRTSSAPGIFSSQAAGSTPSITPPKLEPEQVVLKVAYPEFYDIDKDKREIYFAVDQVWAIFDNLDHMPRNYVRINKVYSPFKVDVTWLEFVPRDIHENAWKRSGLPVACGKFKPLGKFKYVKSQKNTIEDISSFSHKILKKISVHESYNIYPQKGETWALYKNWNMKWSSDPDNHRECKYELVVVLSDYTKKSGICFDPLVKLKGFVCLFKPTKNNLMASCQIPSNEMLRFSHRVPSYRTDGKKRKDVPEGYFELDIRSLPRNLEEVSEVVDMETETFDGNINCSLKLVPGEKHPMLKKRKNSDAENTLDKCSPGVNKFSRMSNGNHGSLNKEKQVAEVSGQPLDKSKATSVPVYEEKAAAHSKEMCPDGVITIPGSVDHDIPFSPSLKIFEMLNTGFCNFDEERSCEKFKAGQIWAVYCKLDKLPKNYALIESVESFPVFKLGLNWLQSCKPPRGIIPWVDKEMPVSCGAFKVISDEVVVVNDSVSFSHQLGVVPAVDNVYTIYPRAGEVWAVYSKFCYDMTCSDLKNCEYDIVEILEVVDVHWIIVSVLERISGFKTVFKAKDKEGLDSTAAIPWIELYRFSHQVPTFLLSGARYGKLRGCWELDPRSLAVY